MRRADRLFQIVEHLRRKPVVTAAELSASLEVSVRTIYRDMDDLSASGLPLRAEAGLGYALEKGYDLPPLMFTREELEALEMAARMLAGWSDPALRAAAESALARIGEVLPHTLRRRNALPFHVPDYHTDERLWAPLPALREALRERRKLWLHYRKEDGTASVRVLRPLGINFWGRVWTLVAWCETRADFRHFRLDRMQDWRVLDEAFTPEPGKTLEDFLATLCRGDAEPAG
jgi:predicted DNA-binding transcriptional regulator YafY